MRVGQIALFVCKQCLSRFPWEKSNSVDLNNNRPFPISNVSPLILQVMCVYTVCNVSYIKVSPMGIDLFLLLIATNLILAGTRRSP